MRVQKKIFVALLMAFSLILSNATMALALMWYDPETGEIFDTPPPPTVPLVRALEPTVITQTAGTTEEHEILLRNIGTGPARNTLVQVQVSADSGATAQFLDRTHSFLRLESGSNRSIRLELAIPKTTQTGNYSIRLEYTYSNEENEKISSHDEITLRIENENESESAVPNLILTDLQTNRAEIGADAVFEISGLLRNTSIADASDIRLTIEEFPADISLEGSSNNAFIQSLKGGSTERVSFQLRTSSNIKQGSYLLVFRLSYRESDKTNEYKYHVNVSVPKVQEDEKKALLNVTQIIVPTKEILVGEDFSATVVMRNVGEEVARNIKVTASPVAGEMIPRSANIQQVLSLGVGESANLAFQFAPTASSVSQNYPISFLVEYDDGSDNENIADRTQTFTQYAGINVRNMKREEEHAQEEAERERERADRERERADREREREERERDRAREEQEREREREQQNASVPKIIISRYESDPVIVQAGQEFNLSMTFQNTHRSLGVRNIDATLTVVESSESKGNVFTPVDSSNSFYMERIAPTGEAEKVLRFSTVPDASPKNYQIQVTLNYEDDNGNDYTSTKLIGINVKQVMKLETSDIMVPQYAQVGESIYFSFSLYNTGRVRLNNLMVRLEGENFDTSNADYYIGSFDIGNSDYYDGAIIPLAGGTQQGRVVISYEDDMGEQIIEETPFTINVQEMMIYDDWDMDRGGGMEWEVESSSSTSPLLIAGIVVGLAVGGGAVFFVRKKRLQLRKERDFDE